MTLWDPSVAVHLELPLYQPEQRKFFVQGWIASDLEVRSIGVQGSDRAFVRSVRPDVEKSFRDRKHCDGFSGIVTQTELTSGALRLEIDVAGQREVRTFTLPEIPREVAEARARKAERLFPLLICPECSGELAGEPPPARTSLSCSRCGAEYDRSDGFFDLLPRASREEFSMRDGDLLSVVDYDTRARKLIDSVPDGLVLDCGAGYRLKELSNVVHFEVAPYPSTHVRGINERLPFRDGTFDAVVSLAVLEHVKDPFSSGREIYRVLKPGGTVLCIVPLMSPVHGYPNHYYNMTASGLRNLFPEGLEQVEQSVPASGLPIFWLTWGLRQWVDDLRGAAKERFLRMRVRDLLEEGFAYLEDDFVTQLSEQTNFDLAATTLLIGKKPVHSDAMTEPPDRGGLRE